MSALPVPYISPERYLEIERAASHKSEYVAGQIYAMAGGSPEHNLIVPMITTALVVRLRPRGCRTFSSDQRVYSPANDAYLYPDVTVTCDEPTYTDRHRDTLTNPTLIVEVLSPSTEAYDRGIKFGLYRQIPSLVVYMLVTQTEPLIEVFTRQADGDWRIEEFRGADATLTLSALDIAIPLADLYDLATDAVPVA